MFKHFLSLQLGILAGEQLLSPIIRLFLKVVHSCVKPGEVGTGLLIVAIAFFGSISMVCAQGSSRAMPSAEQISKANITYKVIPVEEGGYGYDVFVDGKKLIHQTNIPGQPGTAGFKRKQDSEKVAELVIRKLKNKELPPSVTGEELRKLKVID